MRELRMSATKAFATCHSFGTGVAQSLANLRRIFCVSFHCCSFLRFLCLTRAAMAVIAAAAVKAAAATTSFLMLSIWWVLCLCDQNDEEALHFLCLFCFVGGDLRGESNRNPFFVQGGTSIMEGNETCIAIQLEKIMTSCFFVFLSKSHGLLWIKCQEKEPITKKDWDYKHSKWSRVLNINSFQTICI